MTKRGRVFFISLLEDDMSPFIIRSWSKYALCAIPHASQENRAHRGFHLLCLLRIRFAHWNKLFRMLFCLRSLMVDPCCFASYVWMTKLGRIVREKCQIIHWIGNTFTFIPHCEQTRCLSSVIFFEFSTISRKLTRRSPFPGLWRQFLAESLQVNRFLGAGHNVEGDESEGKIQNENLRG